MIPQRLALGATRPPPPKITPQKSRPKKSPRTSSTPISMAPNDECFVVSEDLIDSI